MMLERRTLTKGLTCLFIFQLVFPLDCLAGIATLKSGMRIEGRMGKIHSLADDPYNPKAGSGAVKVKQIVLLDDDLRRTYIASKQIQPPLAESGPPGERIIVKQRVAETGRRIGGVGPILRITPFDQWGRRIFSMNTPRGRIDVIQGITEVTPTYTKVEGLLGRYGYVWDMRIATSSIPRATLSKILMGQIDPMNADDRLRIVRLYIESERYKDARLELEAVIQQFPELAELKKQVKQLQQMGAQRMIREIEFRREAAQHRLAYSMAENFPVKDVAGETLLTVRDIVKDYDRMRGQAGLILQRLERHVNQIEDEKLKGRLDLIHREIVADLNVHTISRMADYNRLADDKEMGADQKVALAVSAWLLGSGAGTENLAVALSLLDVRDAIRQYMNAPQKVERGAILKKLEAMEASDPRNVAKILAHMVPPVGTTLPVKRLAADEDVNDDAAGRDPAKDDGQAAEPKPLKAAEEPPAGDQHAIPGLLTLSTKGLPEDPKIDYLIQLPPEYDPYRRYPCVITLNGAGTTPAQQVDWWAGAYNKAAGMRLGQASRRGYIVIAPIWTKPHQRAYEYSAREHAAVMFSLRDASKRFSIDSDKVFLSGHSMGGDAAWDIGVAHPDTWAGIIPFVATSGKFIPRYWENARMLPMYFVCGQLDGNRMSINGPEWDRYLTKHSFDCMVVEYKGRGHHHFHDEVQRVFEWMALHKRRFFPEEFTAYTMRAWDNYFWWVELHDLPPRSMVSPSSWPPHRSVKAIPTTGRILANNRVSVRTGAGRATIWLSPEMVNFKKRITVSVNGRSRGGEIKASTATILEDVRTRGDRQHPFWAKIETD